MNSLLHVYNSESFPNQATISKFKKTKTTMTSLIILLYNQLDKWCFQACQGSQFDSGVAIDTSDAKGHAPETIQVHKIPSEADFLIAYSVVPGNVSSPSQYNGCHRSFCIVLCIWFRQLSLRILKLLVPIMKH